MKEANKVRQLFTVQKITKFIQLSEPLLVNICKISTNRRKQTQVGLIATAHLLLVVNHPNALSEAKHNKACQAIL